MGCAKARFFNLCTILEQSATLGTLRHTRAYNVSRAPKRVIACKTCLTIPAISAPIRFVRDVWNVDVLSIVAKSIVHWGLHKNLRAVIRRKLQVIRPVRLG